MTTLVLRTTYPCCGKPARITAIVGAPREKYQRDCVPCDTRHEVTRTLAGERGGVRVDTLEWAEVGPLPTRR